MRGMTVSGWTLVGLAMVIVGAAIGAPGLLLIGGLTLLSRWLTTLWSRYGLNDVTFDFALGRLHVAGFDVEERAIGVGNHRNGAGAGVMRLEYTARVARREVFVDATALGILGLVRHG